MLDKIWKPCIIYSVFQICEREEHSVKINMNVDNDREILSGLNYVLIF